MPPKVRKLSINSVLKRSIPDVEVDCSNQTAPIMSSTQENLATLMHEPLKNILKRAPPKAQSASHASLGAHNLNEVPKDSTSLLGGCASTQKNEMNKSSSLCMHKIQHMALIPTCQNYGSESVSHDEMEYSHHATPMLSPNQENSPISMDEPLMNIFSKAPKKIRSIARASLRNSSLIGGEIAQVSPSHRNYGSGLAEDLRNYVHGPISEDQIANETIQSVNVQKETSCHSYDEDPTLGFDLDSNSDHDDELQVKKRRKRTETKLSSLLPRRGEPRHKVKTLNNIPVGVYANKLASTLGCKSREAGAFPLHKKWGEEHDKKLLTVWKDVKRSFTFRSVETGMRPNMIDVYDWCKKTIQGTLKEYRRNLKKKYFDSTKPLEEQIKNTPSSKISQKQWELLLSYWSSLDTKLHAIHKH